MKVTIETDEIWAKNTDQTVVVHTVLDQDDTVDVDHCDVMVLVPDADVTRPLRQRLDLPPAPGNALTWTVTPRQEGVLTIHVVFMVNNDPVFHTEFSQEVK